MAGNTFGLLDSLQCKLMNRAAWSTFSKSSSSGSQASTWTSLARSEVAGATPAALADCFSMGCVSSGFLEGVSSGFHLLQDITYLPTWDKNTSSLESASLQSQRSPSIRRSRWVSPDHFFGLYIFMVPEMVNIQKTNWKITILYGKTHYTWPFSIAILTQPEGISINIPVLSHDYPIIIPIKAY